MNKPQIYYIPYVNITKIFDLLLPANNCERYFEYHTSVKLSLNI